MDIPEDEEDKDSKTQETAANINEFYTTLQVLEQRLMNDIAKHKELKVDLDKKIEDIEN